MSNPEIARRCPTCGASIRERAFFCPQCGNALSAHRHEQVETTEAPTQELPSSAIKPNQRGSDTQPLVYPDQEIRSKNETAGPSNYGRAQGGVREVRAKLQRATALARGVEGDVVHRVQKLREISSVVIDEAAYDPSLRFVLVAVALFLLFLLILLLNKLIG